MLIDVWDILRLHKLKSMEHCPSPHVRMNQQEQCWHLNSSTNNSIRYRLPSLTLLLSLGLSSARTLLVLGLAISETRELVDVPLAFKDVAGGQVPSAHTGSQSPVKAGATFPPIGP